MFLNTKIIIHIQMGSSIIITNTKTPSQRVADAAKQATRSRDSASSFLKSAGIMTPKGNLSPKYK